MFVRSITNERKSRAAWFACLLCVPLGLVISGCSWVFPSEPEHSGPVSLTVVEGQLAFVQCFAPEVHVDLIDVTVDGLFHGEGKESSREVLLAEAERGEGATLRFG